MEGATFQYFQGILMGAGTSSIYFTRRKVSESQALLCEKQLYFTFTHLQLGFFNRQCQKISSQTQPSAKAGLSSNLGCHNMYLNLSWNSHDIFWKMKIYYKLCLALNISILAFIPQSKFPPEAQKYCSSCKTLAHLVCPGLATQFKLVPLKCPQVQSQTQDTLPLRALAELLSRYFDVSSPRWNHTTPKCVKISKQIFRVKKKYIIFLPSRYFGQRFWLAASVCKVVQTAICIRDGNGMWSERRHNTAKAALPRSRYCLSASGSSACIWQKSWSTWGS